MNGNTRQPTSAERAMRIIAEVEAILFNLPASWTEIQYTGRWHAVWQQNMRWLHGHVEELERAAANAENAVGQELSARPPNYKSVRAALEQNQTCDESQPSSPESSGSAE